MTTADKQGGGLTENEFQHEEFDRMAEERYKVVPTKSGFWPYGVVAGDGERYLHIGHRKDCERVARSLAGAFCDGAFVAHGRAVLARVAPSDQIVTALQDIKENASKWHPLHTPQSSEQQAERVTDCSTADCQCDECCIGRGDWAPVSEKPRGELGLSDADAREVLRQAEQLAEEARGVVAYMRPDTGAVVRASQKAPGMTLDDFTVPLVPLAAPAAAPEALFAGNAAFNLGYAKGLEDGRKAATAAPATEQAEQREATFEIRVGGITEAGTFGPRARALADATRYFHQYAADATEDAIVELVEVVQIAAASQPHGGKERG